MVLNMCHVNCIIFCFKNLSREDIEGKKILEIGSRNVNGSVRPIIESYKPNEYIGVDMENGPGVDVICTAESLVERFGERRFDVVISTELIEHTRNWREVISNIKKICKPNGIIVVTTRSYGFGYHGYPYDYWRYEPEDMKNIFSDCEISVLEKDFQGPGVFIKVKKPSNFIENNLSNYKLYSIVVNRKVKQINDKDFRNPYFLRLQLKREILKIGKFVFSFT